VSTETLPPPAPARRVVQLLWAASRRRAAGRALRQREIMGRRRSGGSDGFASFSRLIAVAAACFVHVMLGFFAMDFAKTADHYVTDGGQITLSADEWTLLEEVDAHQNEWLARKRELGALARPRYTDRFGVENAQKARDSALEHLVTATAPSRRHRSEAALDLHRAQITRQYFEKGMAGFVRADTSITTQLLRSRYTSMAVVPVFGLLLLCWLGMLISQGEGLELDVQRRRHPMWEWLLSHPIVPAHAFYAELLTPLMTNPIYFMAPLFLWVLFGSIFNVGLGLVAALLVGLPIAVVASSANKAIETAALLRLSVRTRGAVLGMISWFGYVAMLLPFLLLQADALTEPLGRFAAWLSPWFPSWPVRALLVGWGETENLAEVLAAWAVVIGGIGAAAVWVTHRATARGLQAPSGSGGPPRAALLAPGAALGRNPLQRKELLWLLRDKGAVVQVILIPLTIAATQAFNFRNLYSLTSGSWSAVCGLAIICGTYFLLVLGPRSLASEGAALWLALTWPRGLEDLLKAKARLWGRVANGAVGLVLAAACFMFPSAWWKIALVGCGWLMFSSTLALKAVSLVTAPSSSGEPEPPNRARQWIAMIGTLAFGTGVVTGSWYLAFIGIVYSSLVAVAMWQGLRARLPYLFDPWSEEPVPAPSLLHATVGIALLVEVTGVAIGIASALGGESSLWLARAIGYGVMGTLGCVLMQRFLSRRGVPLRDIVRWSGAEPRFSLPTGLGFGALGGAGLALLATAYLTALHYIPAARETLEEAAKLAKNYVGQRIWLFVLAVVFAPIAEEYFFRGLLFRTLDRELGDWRALVLSAGFFATFHPPLAWVPVAVVGIYSAWLFRTTRHLLPSVICHVAYNAGVLLLPELTR
jgi:membrane protease YdiL (CAAX protease family)